MLLKQSTARNRAILMIDSSDSKTGKTGLTLTISLSKNGGAFATITPSVTELSNGWYNLAFTTSHTDTLGDFALHISGTGADDTDILDQVFVDAPVTSTQVATAISTELDTPVSELAAVPGASVSLRDMVKFIFEYLRNKRTITASTETLLKNDSSTSLGTSTVSDDGTTFTKGKMS